ncbi:alpha-glucan family phosphorylase [Alsobacter soli]|uniref:glycogen phosphorylase n=2 Tax=Alsobacter soli TaxID=2109933 RepID=A0A2T1HLN1_9HYPH|nr:alpha-glucan family phosphorylase [Alsobacter soli]
MEIALRPEIHSYSGGLGILAGDTARSCADLELPVVFVSLASRAGYLRQEIAPDGSQVGYDDPWEPSEWATPLDAMIAVSVEGRSVWIRPWLYVVACPLGHLVPVLLLDTDLDQNAPEDRSITDHLYGGDDVYRLKQEVVLGVGGVRTLQALGFSIRTYHLNEGHAALLTLELLRRRRRSGPNGLEHEVDHVRDVCVFTTHTPVEAGHDRFSYEHVRRVLGDDFIAPDEIRPLAGEDRLNMTRLALNLSGYVNGVARRHAETTQRMFPGYRIAAITNGVHAPTWTHAGFAELYQGILPNWGHEPELLVRADQLPDEEVWAAHQAAKHELLDEVRRRTGISMDQNAPLIGFARRMTGYKRPDLLFSDMQRLRSLAAKFPFQVVVAGKAHPRDTQGQQIIRDVHARMRQLSPEIRMAFLPNYDMALARTLVAGTDVWLNTPLPPLEASGTSGMKAALNGVLNLSVLDGWWIEACVEGVTGWSIGRDGPEGAEQHGRDLYDKLEGEVLPLYYHDRAGWIRMMKQGISKIASYFNSQRMMRRYTTEAYVRP